VLGPGLLEAVYEECLCHELHRAGLQFRRQCEVPIRYEGVALGTRLRLDLVVGDRLIVEVKAVERLLPIHEAQLLTYLKLARLKLGLLLNFNVAHFRDGLRRRVL
jgi:GxxExxY protein